MRRPLLVLLLAAGCHHPPPHVDTAPEVPARVEAQVAAFAAVRAEPAVALLCAPVPAHAGPVTLPALWELALANNPLLRESSAEVEEARGRLTQAGTYPNPVLRADSEPVFSSKAPEGNPRFEVSQEVLTAGKFRLNQAVAGRELDAAAVALLGRKFEVLTRVRRAYYDYLALGYALEVHDAVVRSLEEMVGLTRQLVEKARTRPRSDLVRLEAMLAEAATARQNVRVTLEATWRQVAAEVGLPELPRPSAAGPLPAAAPHWGAGAVERRVQTANTALRQAELESERARLAFERARAEAVPNVTVGAGYVRDFLEGTGGAVFSVEAPVPVWDRKQGRIHEARAAWARAQAARRATATRLARQTAEALGRYESARQEADRLTAEVLPRLGEALRLVREGYRVGAAGVSFADVVQAVGALNEARLRLAGARRQLWEAVADLEGLMQLDVGEELAGCALPAEQTHLP
jgi:outer membrane protein, heavy metal efflux system